MKTIIYLATHNEHKRLECAAILGPAFTLRSWQDVPGENPPPEETGDTYVTNARIKARDLWDKVGGWVFADDSGLEVDFLNGAPGVHSARYSGPDATDQKNTAKLLQALTAAEPHERRATFRCVLVLISPKGEEHSFTGTWDGEIITQLRGVKGFGYDPVFRVHGLGKTAAELSDEEKNRLSHRAQALALLKDFLTQAT